MTLRHRSTPRRRVAPQEGRDWWEWANHVLMVRSGGRCEVCRCLLHLTIRERHHRMRRRDGGDRLANLMYLCRSCHGRITENPGWARDRGYIVSALGGADPAAVPVWLGTSGWFLLDDLGSTQRAQGSPPP